MSHYRINPDFDPASFLAENWQQKPVVIKNFFSDFSDPLEAEELAGLALDETVESRLVQFNGGSGYASQQGPFQEQTFTGLSDENWTLLVQAVDQLVDEVAQLKLAFQFLPSWRIDDVMVSFATPGGGVGPHFDHYDVFLVQGQGSRCWKVGPKASQESHQITESGLKLLDDFQPEQEVTLKSGDVLYIPPGFGHWGVAETAGLCYSIGFRAPSRSEMLEAFSDELMDQCSEFQRFRDLPSGSTPSSNSHPGEIALPDLKAQWHQLAPQLHREEDFYRSFGKLVTRPRYPEYIALAATALDQNQLIAALLEANPIERNPGSSFAWLDPESGSGLWVFADGEAFSQPRENIKAVIGLCDASIENISTIEPPEATQAWQDLLLRLVGQGSLLLPSQLRD
ncbi:MAG: cupin domain-containing protein [Pseudomonadales bacterium]|nr:cupin domain-containing protein [Pseudomonadales bacterium]